MNVRNLFCYVTPKSSHSAITMTAFGTVSPGREIAMEF